MKGQLQQMQGGAAQTKADCSRSQNRKKSWLREKKRFRADIYSISTAKRRLIRSLLLQSRNWKTDRRNWMMRRSSFRRSKSRSFTCRREKTISGTIPLRATQRSLTALPRFSLVFFFLIAAAGVLTTMMRMIDEERTQIGALRGAGQYSWEDHVEHMVHSGFAAMIGCVGGFLAGSKYFPYAILTATGMMFGFAQ